MLNERMIADTIMSLLQSGKQMPQNDRLRNSANPSNTAQLILKETVGLWKRIFLPQNISADKWKKAEYTALTMTKADGLNINIISPALMQEALKRNQAEYLEGMRTKYEQIKQDEQQPVNFGDDYRKNILFSWTKRRLSKRMLIMQDMPSDEEVVRLADSLDIKDVSYNKKLLAIYLADKKYCELCIRNKTCGIDCYLDHMQKRIKVINDKVMFEDVVCDRSIES